MFNGVFDLAEAELVSSSKHYYASKYEIITLTKYFALERGKLRSLHSKLSSNVDLSNGDFISL
jgi:hypothetical protein